MKSIVLAVISLSLLVSIVVTNSIIVSKLTDNIRKRLELAPNDTESAEIYEEIFEQYMKNQKYIGITVSHEDLTNIEQEFNEILGAIEAKDKEALIISKSRLIGALKHLKRLAEINADSIF